MNILQKIAADLECYTQKACGTEDDGISNKIYSHFDGMGQSCYCHGSHGIEENAAKMQLLGGIPPHSQ